MTYEAFKLAEKEGWDARAAAYGDFTGQVTTSAIPTLLAMAETAPGTRILDLCCGTGRAAGAASALGAHAEGIDVSVAMVETARTAFPQVSFETGDAESIPKDDGIYDAVVCSFGVMHVGSPAIMFNEIARVLSPGGRVALSHWVGPPESPLFRIVFGTMQQLADMSVVPPSPPPFALSSEGAMREALEASGFSAVSSVRLPLIFRAPVGQFAEHFRTFAARAAVILDKQTEDVRGKSIPPGTPGCRISESGINTTSRCQPWRSLRCVKLSLKGKSRPTTLNGLIGDGPSGCRRTNVGNFGLDGLNSDVLESCRCGERPFQ